MNLSSMGYVRGKYVRKLNVYMFLIDLVEYMNPYITEADYKKIEKALACLFTDGGCLLKYPVFDANRTALLNNPTVKGTQNFYGTVWYRVTRSTGVSQRGSESDEAILNED